MKKKIFFWGAKYKAGIIYNLIKKKELENFDKNMEVSFLFDPGLDKAQFKSKAKFSNKKKDLENFVNQSNFFVTCIGNEFGKARYEISKKLEKNLTPINIISKKTHISDKKKIGLGVQLFPGSILNENSTLGDYSILNTSAIVEHDCQIGNGVHLMPGSVVGGNVIIKNFVTVGMNATILPNITIEEGAFIGAGSLVTKNVKKNQVVFGNPARFIKKINHKVIIKYLK
jgi:acetyltransferase EpsM